MIHIAKGVHTEPEFIQLLEKSKQLGLQTINSLSAKMTGQSFEQFVVDLMKEASQGNWDIEQTGALSFPDIIASGNFGVEVKVTQKDGWTSLGNSIMETNRVAELQHIYMLFGKLGGSRNIRYKRYEECLSSIGVTHSPRYKIDMSLSPTDTIFHKLNTSYDQFRTDENKVQQLKEYFSHTLKDGETLWWMDDQQFTTPILRQWRTLDKPTQETFIVMALAECPEIFTNKANKFDKASLLLLERFNCICPNFRDIFTAGGKTADGKPHIFGVLKERQEEVLTYLQTTDQLASWLVSISDDIREIVLTKFND